MPAVLTMASEVLCGTAIPTPPQHGGRVSVSSTAKLTVDGQPVLVKDSILGKSVAGCTTPNDSSKSLKTCLSVSSITNGEATKLTTGGKQVMLDTCAGATDGNPPGTVPADAKQDKLTAI
jgi:hypothetical protein